MKGILFVGSRHVPIPINDLVLIRQELIQIFDTLSILQQQLRFAWLRFPPFDEIEDCDWCTISRKKVIKVTRCRNKEGINDANLGRVRIKKLKS
jgi:hypothetical protein